MAAGLRPTGEPRRMEASVSMRRPIESAHFASSGGTATPLSQSPLHLEGCSLRPYCLDPGVELLELGEAGLDGETIGGGEDPVV